LRCRWAAVAVAGLLVGACSNAGPPGTGRAETQGVTSTEIRVGSLTAATGPLGNQYAPISDGVEAYIDMINDAGGVAGRRIKLAAKLDDATSPSRDIAQARALNEQDKVFAVVGVATPVFPGAKYLGANNVPTFGWTVNPEWSGPASLFGEDGSFVDFTGAGPLLPYLAKKVGASKVGTLAYNVAQSQDCATGQANSFRKYGLDYPFQDTSLPFGTTDINADIQRMKQSGVQFMATCMDATGNVLMSRGIRQNGLNITQYWPNGYDQQTLDQFPDLMEGVYLESSFTPFEAASTSPGMEQFLSEMHRRFPRTPISEVVLAGWINAHLFVDGLKAVGRDLTRSKLIAAINNIHDFTADGIWPKQSPIDWAYSHTRLTPYPDCAAFIQVQHGRFVPVFGTPGDPFVCIDHNVTVLPS